MPIRPYSKKTWTTFIALSLMAMAFWFYYKYPTLAFVDLSVDRQTAQNIADQYLISTGVDVEEYTSAIVFSRDQSTNRYLQKTVGFRGLEKFINEHDFDLFQWIIRYYKEGKKEEFRVSISSSDGNIIAFKHVLEEEIKKTDLGEEASKEIVMNFLKERYDFNPTEYTLRRNVSNTLDNRTEYHFGWQKNSVQIPWT
ncbi:MAG: hypothetical protein KC713_04770, partial [Candidatus Omnitrophica bacterium]|nr:hypothetical protein [Candidatus Omnitrophota bacterium]